MTRNLLGYILGDFFTSSSGQSGGDSQNLNYVYYLTALIVLLCQLCTHCDIKKKEICLKKTFVWSK
jgi:hypothetical protein